MSIVTGFEKILRQGELLAPHTWFGLGGPAEYFAEPNTMDELAALVRRAHEEQLPMRVLGGGSNVLVRDEGVKGLVIRLTSPAFQDTRVTPQGVSAGGSVRLAQLISLCVREGFAGLESLVGIPGTVGGALHGNAGGQSGDIGQHTQRATVMTRTGEILIRERKDLVFSYRQSSLDELVILSADFVMDRENPEELTKRMQKQWIMKKASQPMGHQNTGKIFKNPRGVDAGQLIEQAGLKGARVGNVEVNDRHANFFVAEPASTTAEVLRLIDFVRDKVLERVGIELELEIEVW